MCCNARAGCLVHDYVLARKKKEHVNQIGWCSSVSGMLRTFVALCFAAGVAALDNGLGLTVCLTPHPRFGKPNPITLSVVSMHLSLSHILSAASNGVQFMERLQLDAK